MWSRAPSTAMFVQCSIGLLLATLPTVIRPLNFPIACLVPVWFVLTRYLFIADPSLGTHIMFAAFPCFSQTVGVLLGGCMSSLCKVIGGTNPHSSATLAVHSVLLPLGLAPLCAVRSTVAPPLLWVDGLFMVVLYGTTCLLAYSTPSATSFWNQYVVYLLLSVSLSSAAVLLCALLVPVLATRQLARSLAGLLSGAADALGSPGALAAGPQAATSLANPSFSSDAPQKLPRKSPSKLSRMASAMPRVSTWSVFSKSSRGSSKSDSPPIETPGMPRTISAPALAPAGDECLHHAIQMEGSRPDGQQEGGGRAARQQEVGGSPAGGAELPEAADALAALRPPVRLNEREWAAVRRLQAHAHIMEREYGQQVEQQPLTPAVTTEADGSALRHMPTVINQDLRQQEFLQLLQQVTEPHRVQKRRLLPVKPQMPQLELRPEWRIVGLRPQLAAARKLLLSAKLEPAPFLAMAGLIDGLLDRVLRCLPWKQKTAHHAHRGATHKSQSGSMAWPMQQSGMQFNGAAWQDLLQGLSSLLDHLAALEAVASDVRVALALVLSRYGTGPEHCHAVALYHAVQAALVDAARMLQQHAHGLRVWSGGRTPPPSPPRHSLSWHRERVSGAALVHIQAYWAGVVVHTTQGEPVRVHHTEQWRALHFSAVATLQLLQQLQALHPQVGAALGQPADSMQGVQPKDSASKGPVDKGGKAHQAVGSRDESKTRPSTKQQLSASPAAAVAPPSSSVEAPGAAGAATSRWRAAVATQTAWLQPLLPMLYGRDVWNFAVESSKVFRGGWPAVRKQLRDRQVQAGIKYWLVQAVVLVALFIALAKAPKGLLYSPFVTIFMFIAAAATMSDKVETTISKTILRVVGTAVGCLIGWGLMYHPASADNPYAVAVVVVGVGALLSLLTTTTFKYTAMLTQATLTSVALCQYCGQGCQRAGSTKYMLERLVLVSIGCVLPVLVAQLVAPCYLSSWALEKLAGSYVAAAQLLVSSHQQFRGHLMGCYVNGKGCNDEPQGAGDAPQGSDTGTSEGVSGSLHPGSSSRSSGDQSAGSHMQMRDHPTPPTAPQAAVTSVTVLKGSPEAPSKVVAVINPAFEHSLGDRQVGPAPSDMQGGDAQSSMQTGPALHNGMQHPAALQDGSSTAAAGLRVQVLVHQQPASTSQSERPAGAGPHERQPDTTQQEFQQRGAAQQQQGQQQQQQRRQPQPLQLAAMLGPLGQVSEGLARDAPLWQRGVLATPPLVHELMAALTLLADRMAALQVALAGAGSLSQTFSGWVAEHFLKGIDDEMTQVVRGMLQLAHTAAALLAAPPDCALRRQQLSDLQDQLSELMVMRSQVHAHLAELRHAQHERVAALAIKRWATEQQEAAAEEDATAAATPTAAATTPTAAATPTGQAATASDSGTGAEAPNQAPVNPARRSLRALVSRASMASLPSASSHSSSSRSSGEQQAGHATDGLLGAGHQEPEDISDADMQQVLEELMGPGSFHPSDTVAWMACLYALARVLDAALQVGRTAAEAGAARHGPHAMRAADLAAQSWTSWLK